MSTWPLTLPEGFHSFQMEGPTQEEPLSTVKSLREPQDLIERLLPEEQILKKGSGRFYLTTTNNIASPFLMSV